MTDPTLLDTNPAAQASLQADAQLPAAATPPIVRPEHAEGTLARLIEQQTAKIPSHWFLLTALGAIGASAGLEFSGRSRASRFIGQWVGPLMIAGLYNKMVKTFGTR